MQRALVATVTAAAAFALAACEPAKRPDGHVVIVPIEVVDAGAPAVAALDAAKLEAPVRSTCLDDIEERPGEPGSTHLGPRRAVSGRAMRFDRWRGAIESYPPSVNPGSHVPLEAARIAFASYLNGMHDRIHPIFTNFIGSLERLPPDNPINDPKLIARLEIVLDGDGTLRKMGVVKASGVTVFDVAALDAVDRARPFGVAPGAVVSRDGLVYVHWEFHRGACACASSNAQPFLLGVPPSP